MAQKTDIVVGLDIGTTKICAVVGQKADGDKVKILGVGTAPSKGLHKGIVVNIEKTVDSIGSAVDQAEEASGAEVHSVFAGIAGGHIKSLNSRGKVLITSDTKEITQADIDRVIDSAQAIALSIDREIIHAIPQEFIVDGHAGIKNPKSLHGVVLEADVHIVTGNVMSAQNIVKCIHLAGFEVEDIILQPLASSVATLSEVDKEIGAILIDIGGGTTDFIVFTDDAVRHSDVLPLGGDNITRDIAKVLCIPESKAEEIKLQFGHAISSKVKETDTFPLPPTLNRKPKNESLKALSEIIECRMKDILNITKEEIERNISGSTIGAGVVLTGGACLIKGSRELATTIFNNMPTRIGKPLGIIGAIDNLSNPIYATGVGLTKYGITLREKGKSRINLNKRRIFKEIIKKMQTWVKNKFKL